MTTPGSSPIKTVLVVEDSAIQAQDIRSMLEKAGLHTLWAPNGRSGVNLARQHHPAAIVLDIEMPELNGLEVCRLLKQDAETAVIPIIILTAHPEPEVLAESLGSGALDFIPKDIFSTTVLLETLYQLRILETGQPASHKEEVP